MWYFVLVSSWIRFSVNWLTQTQTVLKKRYTAAAAAAQSLQSCPTLCDPIDGSPPGPAIPGILQARTLEWVAISFSNAWEWRVKMKLLSHVPLFAIPWTAAHQAPLSMGFSKQEYWSRVPLPSPKRYTIILQKRVHCNRDQEGPDSPLYPKSPLSVAPGTYQASNK